MNNTSEVDVDSLYPVSTYDDVGNHFLQHGRPGCVEERRRRCIVIAVATFSFPNGDTLPMDFHFWNRVDGSKVVHSETLILNRLQETETKLESNVQVLKLYGSLSPCSACCGRLIKFLNKRPSCALHLAFSTIYQCGEEEHRSALRKLNAHHQVKALDVFKQQDWEFLRIRGNLKLSSADKQWMDRFDTHWRLKLGNILQDREHTLPQDNAAPSPAAATTQNQNTVSPRRRAKRIKRIKKNGQITKPGRSQNNFLSWCINMMKKNKSKNSVTNCVPAPVGQQTHTNTRRQTSVTESSQLVSPSTSRDPCLDKSTNMTEGFTAGNADRRNKRLREQLDRSTEANEKKAREVQESVALRINVVSAAPSENTANETTNLSVNDNESTKL